MKIRTSMSLDTDVLNKVDRARGSYSRSGFINEFLRKGLIDINLENIKEQQNDIM